MATNQSTSPTVYGYLRNSTDKQDLSPEVQRRDILKRFPNVSRWFHDSGVSGTASLERRPALAELLALIKKGDVLAVAKRDRLARDVFMSAWLDKEAKKRGFQIVAADGNGNGDSPTDKLLRQVIDVFAEFEVEMIRMRTRAALHRKRERGEKLGGSVPYGYRLGKPRRITSENGEIKTVKVLERKADEEVIIGRMVRWHRKGEGLRGIARRLNDAGIPGPQKGAWNAVTVGAILRREGAKQ